MIIKELVQFTLKVYLNLINPSLMQSCNFQALKITEKNYFVHLIADAIIS